MNPDMLDRLAAYAPTPASVADEWGPDERVERLAAVLDDPGDAQRRLRFRPRAGALTARAVAPIAASVTVLAVAGTLAVVVGHGSDGSTAGGPDGNTATFATAAPVFHATVATPRLTAHQWAYRKITGYQLERSSEGEPDVVTYWLSGDGSSSRLDLSSSPTCFTSGPEQHASFGGPTQKFVDALPHSPVALAAYLTKHVEGSSSREEAIFVAVGDLLRTGDLLASSAQRAAMVTVLAGLRRTSVHRDRDERGRPAVRVDFLDPNQRGGDIQSLYFDPRTFQLLEERASDGPNSPSDQPSAPYTSTPSKQATSDQQLPRTASVTVMTTEKVVDALPANCGQK